MRPGRVEGFNLLDGALPEPAAFCPLDRSVLDFSALTCIALFITRVKQIATFQESETRQADRATASWPDSAVPLAHISEGNATVLQDPASPCWACPGDT